MIIIDVDEISDIMLGFVQLCILRLSVTNELFVDILSYYIRTVDWYWLDYLWIGVSVTPPHATLGWGSTLPRTASGW